MADLFSVKNRHVMVTGASSGLGEFFARVLAARGAVVTLAARREDELDRVVSKIRSFGGTAHAVVLDVTSEQSVSDAFSKAEAVSGTVTILINNAGVAQTISALDTEAFEFNKVIDTNLRGSWLVARQLATRLVAQGLSGVIVNIASILAVRVAGSVMPYAVSKAGVVHMTHALALEWARYGIRVNAIAPGYFETALNQKFLESDAGQSMLKRIPQRRAGQLPELEGPLLLLASDAGSYMTGSVITVDGGHLVSSL